MNPTESLKYLTLVLLSIECISVCCWNVPSTITPSNYAGSIPAVVTGDGGNGQGEDRGHVLETHHTTCQITTEELVATAQATATRVLTGLCNSREMEERFKNLEGQLSDLLNVLKLMISNLDNKVSVQNEAMRSRARPLQPLTRSGDDGLDCLGSQCDPPSPEGFKTIPEETIRKPAEGKLTEGPVESFVPFTELQWPREEEISRLNNTIHMEPYPDSLIKHGVTLMYTRVFTYYWRIYGISSKINSWDPRRSLRSPSFYITPNGYRMYLLLFPRQNYENFYVHVGITVGINDASLPWPFSLKHRIQLLDQVRQVSSNKNRLMVPPRSIIPQDLASRVWNPALLCSASVWRRPISGDSTECVGLGYPHEILKSRNYIYDDSVVIKLTIYLG